MKVHFHHSSSKKPRKIRNSESRYSRLKGYGDRHNQLQHRSECWFQSLWKSSGMEISTGPHRDQYNAPFPPYIPDCVNFYYRYVIEIDGASHDSCDQQARDNSKDKHFAKSGYKVFRISDGSQEEFNQVKEAITLIRQLKDARGD